ncbi:PLASTID TRANSCRIPTIONALLY ACTIVE protein 6, chloroplastic isoform X2 [Prosopis cineraria]|uniref:PLASTID TRANSCRIPTIONALLY ACTIVE protein 6, chloroplastic isoform X2 n=1 Tax=Prosopis cineraria TaxID=364024 RepID=UPI00241060F3|nr:PLASTID TRANSCRIPTIONALLY ACTIVE protein 6, chloroplastic isoform X2 [Prosopis cineraria]
MTTNPTSLLLFSSPLLSPKLLSSTISLPPPSQSPLYAFSLPFKSHSILNPPVVASPSTRKNPFLVRSDDGDGDASGPDDYEMMDPDEMEEVDNKKDFEIEYDPLSGALAPSASGGDEDIEMVQSKSFVSTQGWDSEMVVDYRINEEEFHKISLFDCDFFIRKPPDPDNDVYDFREYIRCAKSDYGCYNVTEPPIDAPRDPLYKTTREILKVFLTKHYKNRRLGDPEFVLDFEEIYVIDSKTKSITRAKVLVTAPGGRNRDRKSDLLVIRDNGNSFKIIHASERDDPTTVIEREEWAKTRRDMERHLSKLRDFSVSNWF